MNRFIDQYEIKGIPTEYSAGSVKKYRDGFIVAYEMYGARETFSIGQPVYDDEKNLIGYLGIGLYDNLDYSTGTPMRIPVEHWAICLPTKHCVEGKAVYTYWQTVKGGDKE